ncbi:MAG: trigger factor [Clostridia bacterium]
MNYTSEKLNKSKQKFTVTFEKTEWEKFLTQAFEKTKGKFKVQGFRDGKAPRNLIEKQYGEMCFFDEALDIAFHEAYSEILHKETSFTPIESPSLALNSIDEKGISFSLEVEGLPEVVLSKKKGFGVVKGTPNVKEELVDAELMMLQDKQARFIEASSREAKNSDTVTIDFSGSIDGVKFEGGTGKDYRLVLGSHSFIDTFEDQIVGMKTGETKDVNVKFPEEYQAKELAGKDAIFEVKLSKIEEKELPALDDTFASNSSEFETLDALKASIKEKLMKEAEKRTQQEFENSLINAIVESATVEVPSAMIERQIDALLAEFEQTLAYRGLKLQDYVNYTKSSIEKIREQRKNEAEHIVKTRLVLGKLIDEEKIEVKEEEVEAKIATLAENRKKSVEEMKKLLSEKDLAYLENDIIMDKVVAYLVSNN